MVNSFTESRCIRNAAYNRFHIPYNRTYDEKRILYVSRCCGPKRWNVNEEEVMDALRTIDAHSVMIKFDNMTFEQQVQIMANTDLLISIHGAQLTNALFMRPGSGVIEIFNPKFKTSLYYNLCKGAELKYEAFFGTVIAEEVPIEIRKKWWCLTVNYNTIVNISLFLPVVKTLHSKICLVCVSKFHVCLLE